jgi:hypothetical protein
MLRKKKFEAPKGHWVLIDYMKGSYELCRGVRIIKHMYGTKETGEAELYTGARVRQLMESGIPVVYTHQYPCMILPEFATYFGRVRWFRRFPP